MPQAAPTRRRAQIPTRADRERKNYEGTRAAGITAMTMATLRNVSRHPRPIAEQRPGAQEGNPAERRYYTEPPYSCQTEHVQTDGKQNDSGKHQPARKRNEPGRRKVQEHETDRNKAERVIKVILHAGLIYREHVRGEPLFETVRTEGTQSDA